jgi:hypothetical protein
MQTKIFHQRFGLREKRTKTLEDQTIQIVEQIEERMKENEQLVREILDIIQAC